MMSIKETRIDKDLAAKKLFVVREFDAPPDLVWRAWTEKELLDQWWAPHPWKTETKSMDFREGGTWIYSMNGPEGEKQWCREDYLKIIPRKSFSADDAFCDESGKPDANFPRMHWNNNFIPTPDGTRVEVEINFDKEEDIKTIVEMGFEQGFTAAHGNLDELLAKMQS
jgi:uncharacterized protein YndB with AHSA1/START domain